MKMLVDWVPTYLWDSTQTTQRSKTLCSRCHLNVY